MRVYLMTKELEDARGCTCGSCGKDEGFQELLDINLDFSHELGRLNRCINCGEHTLVLDDMDGNIVLNKPVMVDWETEFTVKLRN